jgi:tRNA-splicing ligase RtcB
LPIAVAGAQMPDGHVGYGLPIGGVLATRNAVIPYGVGVDIACRMKLSVVDEDASRIAGWRDRLRKCLIKETCFGVGGEFRGGNRRDHDVMDDPAWRELPPPLAKLQDKAWAQLGSSGSGNHFVEFGELVFDEQELGLSPGRYLALLSHSGSRGFGSNVAKYYTDLARETCNLPKEFRQLAWLSLSSSAGQEYWAAMQLAGRYAAANHDLIHRHVLRAARLEPAAQVENHHNFAWKEQHRGEEVIVHRKGATPAGEGMLGVIPGSMGDPGYVVRGKGHPKSLDSAAHGAGRKLSRKAARNSLTRHQMKEYLEERGVELISAGVDEAPMAYKNIDEVMAAQKDLVRPIAQFVPRIVLMSTDKKAED